MQELFLLSSNLCQSILEKSSYTLLLCSIKRMINVVCGVACVVEAWKRTLSFFQVDLEELEKDFICMKL